MNENMNNGAMALSDDLLDLLAGAGSGGAIRSSREIPYTYAEGLENNDMIPPMRDIYW
ncbi:MAG: hypothetical protein Q4B54_12680 [Coriobacteriales bacterium]|nr:hypothetical protein [Coriobacteriales bacterium]